MTQIVLIALLVAVAVGAALATRVRAQRAELLALGQERDRLRLDGAELAELRAKLAEATARLEMSEQEKQRLLEERGEEAKSLRQIDQLRQDITSIKDDTLPRILDHGTKAVSGADRVESRMLGWMQTIANPQSRGVFGELAVENQLQNLGLELGRDYMKQVTSEDGGKRPDYIVRAGQGSVIVDAKFALDEELESLGQADGEDRAERLLPFGRKLKARAEELSKRDYGELGRGPTAVLLYVPIEGAHEALRALPGFSLDKFSRRHRVYVVTPSQLPIAIGLVAEVAHVARRDDQIEQTAKAMLGMAEDMCTFVEGLDQHGKHLQTAFTSYDKLVAMTGARGKLGRRIKSVLDFARRQPKLDAEVRQLTPPRDDASQGAEHWREQADPPAAAGGSN